MNSLVHKWEYGATVAQAAVNREVVGSNPSIPAKLDRGRKSIKSKTLVDDPVLIFK